MRKCVLFLTKKLNTKNVINVMMQLSIKMKLYINRNETNKMKLKKNKIKKNNRLRNIHNQNRIDDWNIQW